MQIIKRMNKVSTCQSKTIDHNEKFSDWKQNVYEFNEVNGSFI